MPPTGRLHSERRPAHSSQPSQNRLPGCIWQYDALRNPRRSATPVRGGARCRCHRAGAQGRMFVRYASTPIPGELAPEATMRREDGEGRVVCPCRRVMTGRAGGASLCMFGWIPAKATLSPTRSTGGLRQFASRELASLPQLPDSLRILASGTLSVASKALGSFTFGLFNIPESLHISKEVVLRHDHRGGT